MCFILQISAGKNLSEGGLLLQVKILQPYQAGLFLFGAEGGQELPPVFCKVLLNSEIEGRKDVTLRFC